MRTRRNRNVQVIIIVITVIVLSFVLGVVFGKFVLSKSSTGNNKDVAVEKSTEETLAADATSDTIPSESTEETVTVATQPITEPKTEPVTEPETEPTTPHDKTVALTFDDGPNPDTTSRILEVLQEYGGKATFFVLGERLENYPKTLKKIYDAGSEVGNHTYYHKNLNELSTDEALNEVTSSEDKIKSIVDVDFVPVRLPYGNGKENFRRQVPAPIISWSLDTEDWKSRDKDTIVQMIMDNVQDGDIILMHDIYESTAEAVEEVVPLLVEQGYRLATVSELFEEKGLELNNGEVYYSTWQKQTTETEDSTEDEDAEDTEDSMED